MTTPIDLASLQDTLGYHFKDEGLLTQALTHSSFAYESKVGPISDNNRLEFLGDSILGMAVADHLCSVKPDLSEGSLTKMRASVVNRDHLSAIAAALELGKYLLLGKGEEKIGGRTNPTNLSGSLEAVIAAIYLDGGFEPAKKFVVDKIIAV